MNLVVTDTGPVLHLHEIGMTDLLSHFGSVHVTPTVLRELQRHAPGILMNGMPSWLIATQPSQASLRIAGQWVSAQVLDAGEAEALAFAQEIKADLFITDDTAARTLGESLGLQVRGSLGVILFAAANGYLDQTATLKTLDDLEQGSTLWMSAKVKQTARNAVVQIFGQALNGLS